MKKLLGIALFTALVFAATERPAQAWVNSRFSVGLNWSFQSGGNSALWGAWRNGQVPGPWGDGIITSVCATGNPPHGYPGMYPHDGHGYYPPAVYPHAGGGPTPGTPAVPAAQSGNTQQAWNIPNWYAGQNVYQTVGYNYPNYNYGAYSQPGYGYYPGYYSGYYPGYDYGALYQAPSYWYGR